MSPGDAFDAEYPPDAYAPNGILWWELEFWPNPSDPSKNTRRPYGQECKLAAWLMFNKRLGGTFTMRELRRVLGAGIADTSEHLNRRLRELRKFKWRLDTAKDDSSLGTDEYRFVVAGAPIWLPGEKAAHKKFAPSAALRRRVYDRDGGRCVHCGRASREPDGFGGIVTLTIGHRVPQARLNLRQADDNIDNWQTECTNCNSTVRDELPDPHTLDEVLPAVTKMKRDEKRKLHAWLVARQRLRDDLDRTYDIARMLSENDRAELLVKLERMI
ncbi:HNH endonuclease [Xylanimonas sp. McL0601]|uniref:HNH endonuclease n=1 Tax=Xylanimonas sp. McL0601 TaxID=3414739 RepID=UPI003CE8DB3B